jgi:hypothetical protein
MSKRAMKEGCTYPKPQVSREITVTGLRADRSAPTIENATARPHRASSGPRATYDARTVRGVAIQFFRFLRDVGTRL